MAPPYSLFQADELPERVQTIHKNGKERRRKDPIDLKQCELMQMMQYDCQGTLKPKPRVVCVEYLRLFRKCANGVSVETTEWEAEERRRLGMGRADGTEM